MRDEGRDFPALKFFLLFLKKGLTNTLNERIIKAERLREDKTMTVNKILEIIESGEHEAYGIRRDRAGLEVGHEFDNSHQWWQDDPSEWGEECEYNEDLGLWDGGELDGICTLRISDRPTVEEIEKVLKRSEMYAINGPAYLVGGDWAEGGNDIGESIIHNGVCVAVI